MPPVSNQQREWAKRGALARLEELDAERAAILRAFPDLRGAKRPASVKAAAPSAAGGARRQMSDAAKKRMSAGMRKYWKERKAREKAGKNS